jgi:unsaturated rhamnogalacturonyl hydrolase
VVEGYPPVANELALSSAEVGKALVYYFGSGWSKSGDFTEADDWDAYVSRYRECLKEPLEVKIVVD